MARSVVGHCGWEVLLMTVCVLACLLLALPGGLAFLPNFWSRVLTLSWNSHTHQYMTEQALLNVTLSTLRAVASGRDELGLGRGFWRAVGEVVWANAAMDFLSTTRSDPVYHFDSERVGGAQGVLRLLWAQTLLSARAGDYQDFYSHSNWVEMGQRSIYLHLLHPEQPAVPVASEDTPTCAECYTATCRDNILLRERPPVLTTGYFSTNPPKPAGKCSHGGLLDSSRHQGAQGGINKDSTSPFFSPHHYLHSDAARLATAATVAALQDLRGAIGTASFLSLFSIRQQPALVFVMDTTGSMFEEITAARRRAFSIIQARARANQQPGKYLLIPFHDPAVGPVYETEDPEQFMLYLEGLTALGGGDEPEMCLSAVQLALTHSPPLSEIFVFTDASPKDAHLYSTVEALTLEKQSKVSFLLTEDSRHRRERRSPDRFSLYSSLSSVSGGLAIFTSNSDIHRVSAIIEDHIAASKVTLLHVGSSSLSEATHFPFRVDSAVRSVTLHLTGTLKYCMLTSPSGESQSLLVRSGSLAELEVFQGLYRVILLPPIQLGQWHLSVEAEGPVTLNVIGNSTVDFLYYFAVAANGTHPGLERVEGSPVADVPTFLVLAVTGLLPNEEASFSHVTLLGANGESLLKVPLNSSSSSSSSWKQLVGSMAFVPREPFNVQLSGRDTTGNRLERVATEMIQPTHVRIQVLSAPPLIPGHTSKVTFDVLNYGPARHFTLTTADDRGFLTKTVHRRLSVGERGSLRGEVDVRTLEGAEPGGAVTVTLTVRAEDSSDSNYAVVHLSVLPPDPDVFPPSCSPVRVEAACPPECSGASWAVSLAVTDRGHSGLAALQLTQGHGVLTLLLEPSGSPLEGRAAGRGQLLLRKGEPQLNITSRGGGGGSSLHVRYTSNCCSPHAEITAWDAAGNAHRCHLTPSQQAAVTHKPSSGAGRVGLALFAFQCCLLGFRLLT